MKKAKLKCAFAIVLTAAVFLGFLPASAASTDETIESNRFNVVIVTDASGSMRTTDPGKNRFEAIKLFTNLLAEKGNVLGGVVFSSGIDAQSGLHVINSQADKDGVTKLLSSASSTGGWTNIGDALTIAVDMLCEQGDPSLPCVIVFLSDGNTAMGSAKETDASLGKKAEALQKARENGITIYGVCLNADYTADTSEMEQLASATGGEFREVNHASDLREVFSAFYNLIYGTSTISLVDDVIPSGGTLETGFDVPSFGIEEVNIIIYGNASDISVKRPDGSDYLADIQRLSPCIMLKLTDLAPGQWTLVTSGVPGDQIKINMVYNTDFIVDLQLPPDGPVYGDSDSLAFSARLISGGAIATGRDYDGFNASLAVMDAYDNILEALPMSVLDGGFQLERTFTAGTYRFQVHVAGNNIEKDSAKSDPITVMPREALGDTPVENAPPSPVRDTVKRTVYTWPFRPANFTLDITGLATDPEDEDLRYSIISSSFLEGKDYSVNDDVLTVRNFSLHKGAFTVRATDPGGLSCEIEVIITHYNIGVIAACLIAAAGLLTLAILGFLTYRSLLIPFMGTITAENVVTRQSASMQKSRGRLRLSLMQIGATGLGRNCYFQATAKNYIYFVSPKPVYANNMFKPAKKVKIAGNMEVKISSSEGGEDGIYVTFNSMLNSSPF